MCDNVTLKHTIGRPPLLTVRPDPALLRWREQWGVEEHHLIPSPESTGPTHHLYPVWESGLLKPICSKLPIASSKTLMRQEPATRRARKPETPSYDQRFSICQVPHEQSAQTVEKLHLK